ncbi:carbohydrate kinase [Salmonella enterica]|uniref:Carbohydrate kinase n=1 Tax=Salmonella enterica subsp. enterica serovar Durham TaxID=1954178 RepID=A0A5H7NLN0_SALET|nr:FGGY-family carbohydrate kinase [Salmonella enterica]EAA2462106.1 carbohydrate kinase [Salmonella enterica subsp. enterica serovar Durham]EBZ2862446.1 carbohydrate kinase [Salmonella enterica subsp. enterica serovar Kibi]ECE8657414.1 carbohydrate kinase [Salmonella enterica subsp. enterica]ECG7294276.1 carbohydrate kinase [Salmonella enterica subsp. enterica serovar Bahati]ECR4400442.1 carbohydrate kinase [Salmonella enterica subsp. enterica serovar Ona]EEI6326020.1 carbohydrate kinase [Sa
MSNYWLGLDCGGSWLKAGLYDGAGREVAVQRLPLHALSPQPGWVERDMTELWQQCGSVISKLLTHTGVSGSQIRGLGISAQGKGLFLLDKSDRPLGKAILSSDRRAMEIVQRWQKEAVPQKLYPLTRQTLWTGHPVSLLRWVKENEPQRYAQIGCVMMTHDYLRWCLTGVKGCEESNISESNLYNMATGQYDLRLTEWLGISEIDSALPPVVGSAEICGEITAQAAAITGLAAGTPVVGGLFDVVSTALCAGIEDESTLNAVMGTWAVTSGIAHGLRDHEAHPYVYGRYVNDGQYIVHEASPTSSGNLEWFTAQWGYLSFDEINQAVASLPKAGSDLFFLPFLYGSNAGLEMTCGFYGMQALHTRAHLLQAIYEGVVFSHMTHLNRMRERFTDVCALRVTGGPAHSDVWMQMLADVSGLRIELPQVEETGCFGAALAARVGTGVYRDFREAQRDLQHPVRTLLPDMTAHALYQRKYRQYQHLIEALQGYHARIKEHAL